MNRKANFTAGTNQQIKVYKHLLEGVKVCRKAVAQFDGKVPNVRLIRAMTEQANPHRLSYSLNGSISISDYQNRSYPMTSHTGYVDSSTISVKVVTTDTNRMDGPATIAEADKVAEYLKAQIAQAKKDLLLYDEEAKAWADLEKHVQQYKDTYSPRLRGDIYLRK